MKEPDSRFRRKREALPPQTIRLLAAIIALSLISWIGQSLTVSDAWGSEMDYFGFKLGIVTATGLDMDALHVHAGIIVQLLAALILRRSLRSPLPWLVVLVAVLANEAYDLHYDPWPAWQRAWQIAESVKDVWNTLAMPTLLALLARFAPRLLTAERHGDPNPQDLDRSRLKQPGA